MFGQLAATSQFYLYGRSNCTRTGWESHSSLYEKPDLLEGITDLSNKVFMITGANAGIGKEITTYLASKQAKIFMVCRNPDRAEAAKAEIVQKTKNDNISLLVGDCGLEADIRRMWSEFVTSFSGTNPSLDGLICNAGALLNDKTLTVEGVEVLLLFCCCCYAKNNNKFHSNAVLSFHRLHSPLIYCLVHIFLGH